MDNETKELLKQNLELAEKNNAMLSKLVRAQKWATAYRVAYWLIIILSGFGLLYFMKPLLGNLLNAYGVNSFGSIGTNFSNNQQQINDFVNSMKSK